jgi:hypothetical protein
VSILLVYDLRSGGVVVATASVVYGGQNLVARPARVWMRAMA